MTNMKPAITNCNCPKYSDKLKNSFTNHTYACLVARRGNRTMEQYYGPPAKIDPRSSGTPTDAQLARMDRLFD